MKVLRRAILTKLPAATLAEVLVALGLTSLVFVIGTMIWMNLNTQEAPLNMIRSRLVAGEMIDEVQRTGRMGEETVLKGGVRYLREVKPLHLGNGKDLLQVTITCLDADGREFMRRSKIVRAIGDE